MAASRNVKAGIRLSMAVPSIGELNCKPTYPKIWAEHLHHPNEILNLKPEFGVKTKDKLLIYNDICTNPKMDSKKCWLLLFWLMIKVKMLLTNSVL